MATTRHKKAAKYLRDSTSRKDALLKAGYSESYANTGQITYTKGWQEVLEKALPDELLAKRHRELLNKREEKRDEPETQAVTKGLDMAYKLKGSYAPEKHKVEVADEENPMLEELAERLNEILKK